jgi:hypothetical protein
MARAGGNEKKKKKLKEFHQRRANEMKEQRASATACAESTVLQDGGARTI